MRKVGKGKNELEERGKEEKERDNEEKDKRGEIYKTTEIKRRKEFKERPTKCREI